MIYSVFFSYLRFAFSALLLGHSTNYFYSVGEIKSTVSIISINSIPTAPKLQQNVNLKYGLS